MIRPILPPVLPPITPIVKVAAADFVLQIAAGAVILGIFTLAVWIMLRHSKKDLNEPIIPAALIGNKDIVGGLPDIPAPHSRNALLRLV